MNPYCNKIMSAILGYTLLMQPLSAVSATPESSYFQIVKQLFSGFKLSGANFFRAMTKEQASDHVIFGGVFWLLGNSLGNVHIKEAEFRQRNLDLQVINGAAKLAENTRTRQEQERDYLRPRLMREFEENRQKEARQVVANKAKAERLLPKISNVFSRKDKGSLNSLSNKQRKYHELIQDIQLSEGFLAQKPENTPYCQKLLQQEEESLKAKHENELAAQAKTLQAAQKRLAKFHKEADLFSSIPFEKHPYKR